MGRPRVVASFVAAALLISACTGTNPRSDPTPGGGTSAPQAADPQTNEGGQVTVVASWLGPASGATFAIKLDTHSVDLDALDLSDAVLRNDRGESLRAQPWQAAMGGHHREGTLSFDGDPKRFLDDARWIELILSGVGDIPERTLRWDLGS